MDRLLSPQTKRIVLVVLAVALVALAGCNTGGDTTPSVSPTDTDELTETTTDDEQTTTDDEQTTTDDEQTTTDDEQTTTDSQESDVDPEELAASHTERIDSASSLTTQQQFVQQVEQDGNTSLQSQQLQGLYNLDDSVGLERTAQSSQSQMGSISTTTERYTAGNQTYLRQNSSQAEEPQFAYDEEPYNESRQPNPVNFTSVGYGQFYSEWEPALQSQGETELQGETVQEYYAEGEENLPYLSESLGASLEEIETINATVLVTDDGLVTQTVIQVAGTGPEGGETSSTLQFTVTDVDETTVEEPDWLDQVNTTE